MREYMIAKRQALGLSRREMAGRCGCSEGLLTMLEENSREITHPKIAAWIAKEYGMDVAGYNQLVHKKHRAKTLPKPVPLVISDNVDRMWRSGWRGEDGDFE